jgi:hypothetical protein
MSNPSDNGPGHVPDPALDPHLHPNRRAAYIACGGMHCPFCNGARIEAVGAAGYESGFAWQNIECPDCGALWLNYYQLIDVQVESPPTRADLRAGARWGSDQASPLTGQDQGGPPPPAATHAPTPPGQEQAGFTPEDIALVEEAYWQKTPEARAERRRHFIAAFKELDDFLDLSDLGPALALDPAVFTMMRRLYRWPLGCRPLCEDCCLVFPE